MKEKALSNEAANNVFDKIMQGVAWFFIAACVFAEVYRYVKLPDYHYLRIGGALIGVLLVAYLALMPFFRKAK